MFFYAGSPIIIAQTQSIMIGPTMEATGLPATAVTISPWIILFLGLLQPVAGWLLKRYSPRPFLITTVVVNALALLAFATLPPSWPMFWGIAFAVGIFGSLGYFTAISRMLSFWYRKNLGLAVGIVGGAASLLPLIALPVMTSFIYNGGGWRAGYWTLFVYVVVVTLPMVIWLFRKPKEPLFADDAALESTGAGKAPEAAGMELRDILRDSRFWTLAIGFGITNTAVGGFLANIAVVAQDRGFDARFATGLSMAMLVGVLLGRVVGGVLVDRIWSYAGPILVFTVSGVGAVLLGTLPNTTPIMLMWIVAATIGLSQGAEGDYITFFSLREFGAKNFTVVNGILLMLVGVSTFAGGITFAIVKDLTGSYSGVSIVISFAFFVGAVLTLLAGLVSIRAHRNGAQLYAGKDAANLDLEFGAAS
ncbi:MFS transporter [Leucobacter allii]|uniref:MFS transporter n=1 Tax=Leucobacter allii TaxID=2932247 RepID=A0ABY4FMQ4_9MICO|nr:MFS transporter [Leucobacter allii]UOQ57524.1 MFS transporter [Leucobacter allii]